MIRENANKKLKGSILFLSLGVTLFATTLVRSEQSSEQQIIDRIKPAGVVCVAGENCDEGEAAATPAVTSAAPAAAARSGEAVYNQACVVCHAAGVAGAPVTGNKEAWADRIGNGMDSLMNNAINGLNAMPPRGTCMDCSDEEIQAAIQFIVDASQ